MTPSTPTKEDFAHWSRVWHDTCETMATMLGLPGCGSPQELLAQVQAYVSTPAPTDAGALADEIEKCGGLYCCTAKQGESGHQLGIRKTAVVIAALRNSSLQEARGEEPRKQIKMARLLLQKRGMLKTSIDEIEEYQGETWLNALDDADELLVLAASQQPPAETRGGDPVAPADEFGYFDLGQSFLEEYDHAVKEDCLRGFVCADSPVEVLWFLINALDEAKIAASQQSPRLKRFDIKPRRPFEDSRPDGMLESDRDFVENNMDVAVAFLEGRLSPRLERERIYLTAKGANLRFWRDSAAQQAAFKAWQDSGFNGDGPQHTHGTLIDYIADAILALLSPDTTMVSSTNRGGK